jgi:hypothetical protein
MGSGLVRLLVRSSFVAAVLLCAAPVLAEEHSRLFGVLPNYTTVDERPAVGAAPDDVPALSTKQSFKMASLSSFDPVVFPCVGVMTLVTNRDASFGDRYMRAFADNSLGNFLTTAVVPSLTNQDSRYFRSGEGSVFRRMAYAASRSVVTRTRSGHAAFNVSEIGGNLAAAGLSNVYYDPADRTVTDTMSRWGTQVMWDTVANELKEFWPDIRTRIRKH